MDTYIPGTINLDLLCRAEVINNFNKLKEHNSRQCYMLHKNITHHEAITMSDDSDDSANENEEEMPPSGGVVNGSADDSLGWLQVLAHFDQLEVRIDAQFNELQQVNTIAN